MNKVLQKIIILFIVITNTLVFSSEVFALEKSALNLSVSPPVLEIEVDPGETITEVLSISSGINEKVQVITSIEDFYYDENDKIKFMSNQEKEDEDLKKFILSNWISIEDSITLESRNSIEVPITITVPKDATPGGRYATVFFRQGDSTKNGEGVNVGLAGKIGSMILVSVRGEFTKGGEISERLSTGRLVGDNEFNPTKLFLGGSLFKNGPVDFKFRYKNYAPTHVVPAGYVEVKNIFGGKVGTVDIVGRRVFPGVSRSIYGTLEKGFLFGIYKARLDVINGEGHTLSSSTFFIGFPLKLVSLIILLVLSVWLFFKYYNKWLINKVLKEHGKRNAKKK